MTVIEYNSVRREVPRAHVIARFEAHYEAQEVSFGVVYRRHPQHVVVECDCGETATFTGLRTTCSECGANHATVVRKELAAAGRLRDEVLHPWCYAGDREDAGLPY